MSSDTFSWNHSALKGALKDLEVDFVDGPKEFVMQCIFDDCTGHKRPFYLNSGDYAGVWHCFRCDRRGGFADFVRKYTGWSEFRVGALLRKWNGFLDPNDEVERNYAAQDVSEDTLDSFAFRHEYCYDRGLREETLRRYRIGYDRENNEITFPWFDRSGNLLAIKRRGIVHKHYRFMASGSFLHTVFGLHLVRPQCVVWICEGEFDCMYLDQCFHDASLHNEHCAVALGGKTLQIAAQQELMQKSPKLAVLATDNDDDGSKAAEQIARLLQTFIPTYRLEYESGRKDPNESSFDHIVTQAAKANSLLTTHNTHQQAKYQKWLETRTAQHG